MLYNYIKTAFRHLWKNKLYAVINVLGLAVALTCMVLSILYYKDERSFDSFHKNIPNLFRITTTYTDNKTGQTERGRGTAQVQGPAFKAQVPEILDYVRMYGGDVMENVKSSDKAFTLGVGFVDSGFFKVFSFPLLFGDPTSALNEKYSIVITEKTARKFFGKTDVVGKRLDIEDNPDSLFASFIITGVAKDPPPNSSIQFDILIPFSYLQFSWYDDKTWLNNYLPTFVVLHPQADLKALQQKFISIHNVHAKEQLEQGKKTGEFDKQTFYTLQPVTDIHLSQEGGFANSSKPAYSWFLVGISAFILIMASINFINLSIAGSLKRAKEIGVRKISGSSKMQIIWQFLIESSIICITALCMAIILAQNLLPFFNQVADKQIMFSTLLDWKLLAYFICLLIINILLAGLYPSYTLARFKPTEVLYNKPALSDRNWLGKGLVVLQFAIAICLIIGSIIYYRQMGFIRTKELGYNPHHIIRIDPPFKRVKLSYPVIKNELAKEPGIKQVSLETHNDGTNIYISDKVIKATYKLVENSYIPMLEIPLKQGRNFSDLYPTDKTNAAVVNEAFVRVAGLENPIGAQLQTKDWFAREALTIIGVVKDYHRGTLKEIIQPEVLAVSDGSQGSILVKIDKHRQKQSLAALEKAYRIAVPGSEYSYAFWDELNAREYQKERKWQQIVTIATALSILICCLGLFGLTHLATHRRIKEIGIRKVLGASVSNITSLITKDFIKLIVIAVIIASPIAWYFMNKWLQDFAYRITISWWIFLIAGIIALLIALITVSMQAIKAAMANPVKSLRTE